MYKLEGESPSSFLKKKKIWMSTNVYWSNVRMNVCTCWHLLTHSLGVWCLWCHSKLVYFPHTLSYFLSLAVYAPPIFLCYCVLYSLSLLYSLSISRQVAPHHLKAFLITTLSFPRQIQKDLPLLQLVNLLLPVIPQLLPATARALQLCAFPIIRHYSFFTRSTLSAPPIIITLLLWLWI